MSDARWGDLRTRVISAVGLVGLGGLAIWAGHAAFTALLLVAAAVGAWELWSMRNAKASQGGLAASDHAALRLYGLLFALGIGGLFLASLTHGRGVILFLVALVAITDTLGYFAGKMLGGPKFWPAISPKKTWSGILGGWAGAAVFGLLAPTGLPFLAIFLLSVALSLASQLGDIAESAIKRRMGVKDSSNIIPGHGGVLDRFDGLIAVGALAGLFILLFG